MAVHQPRTVTTLWSPTVFLSWKRYWGLTMASNQLCTAYPVIRFSPTWWDIPNNGASRV